MSTKFYTLLTDIGAAKLASAAALGVPLKITHMAVGDGGGTLPTPDAKQTGLVNEKRRAALNMLYIDPQNSSQIIAEQVIPENEGGWWIREVGLFDESGALIAVGNCPESYKPQLAEGSGRIWSVRCSAQSDRSCGYCTGGRGAGCLEILATHHRISWWRGGGIQSGGRSRQ